MLARTLGAAAALLLAAGVSDAQLSGTYRLDSSTSMKTSGCQPPCLCPISLDGSVRGTFELSTLVISQFVQRYAVDDVNWTVVDLQGGETKVKGGDGFFTRTSSPFGITQQLELVLSIDGGPKTFFDSGVVPGSTFPNIVLAIADNDFYCLNEIFAVDASPVPKSDITRYQLVDTTYQEGCFPPCLCPILNPVGVAGTFDLVLLEKDNFTTRYGITNVDWKIKGQLFGSRGAEVTGTGDYSVFNSLAALPSHEILLCLDFNGVELAPFSGGPEFFPNTKAIEIVASQSGMVCFDRVFDLHAKPVPSLTGASPAMSH
jgi:hypothetical protein